MSNLALSHSAIESFQKCPAFYYFKYERRITRKEESEAPLLFGAAIHEALQIKGEEGDLKEASEVFLKSFPSDLTNKHTIKAGKLMIKEYYNRYRVEPFKILLNEEKFEVDLGECLYKMKIDKLIIQDGQQQVIDHKTTSDLGNTFFEMTNPNGQFTGYIYGANERWGEVNTLIVDGLLVPYPYKTKELQTDFQRIPVTKTPKELELWKENTISVARNIKKCRDTDVWTKNYHVYQRCVSRFSECAYKMLCVMPMKVQEVTLLGDLYKERNERD